MEKIEKDLLKEITGIENGKFEGAYNIRKDGQGVERQITENINIVTKKDVSGIDIYVKENTKFEIVHIPVIITQSGIKDVVLYESGVFDEIGKTPTINMRMIALGFLGLVDKEKVNLSNENLNAYDLDWFNINDVPNLAFLHNDMIKASLENLRELIIQSDILKVLLPNEFTMPELQNIFEAILCKTFDRRNFRKKILSLNIVDDTKKEISINGNKPSKLYKFKKNLEKKKVF